MDQNEYKIAKATVYQICQIRNGHSHSRKKSHSNRAFVKFLDQEGNESDGNFLVSENPIYSAIRIDTQVEILYRENKTFGGYQVFLKDPLRYERIPSDQERVPYEENSKLIRKQAFLVFLSIFGTALMYGTLRALWPGGSFWSIILFICLCYKIVIMGFKNNGSKFATWKRDDSMEWPE